MKVLVILHVTHDIFQGTIFIDVELVESIFLSLPFLIWYSRSICFGHRPGGWGDHQDSMSIPGHCTCGLDALEEDFGGYYLFYVLIQSRDAKRSTAIRSILRFDAWLTVDPRNGIWPLARARMTNWLSWRLGVLGYRTIVDPDDTRLAQAAPVLHQVLCNFVRLRQELEL